jgi:Predicted DNA modification methylase
MGDNRLENHLNDLNGAEWLYWTNTIYETNFPLDETHRLRKMHGAMKPPALMAEIIKFFTKHGEMVLDPFAGVGGTLLGAGLVGRKALGIEINPAWVAIYAKIVASLKYQNDSAAKMLLGDCLQTMAAIPDESVAAIITDPPYGCQGKAIGFKNETHFNMKSDQKEDFGNCNSYPDYFQKIKAFGVEAYRLLQANRYLVVMIGDRYAQGEYLPLGVRVAETLREVGFSWKGMRIWWNKATQRPLKPYAIKSCFVPNITHQNIIIMRKENKSK